MPNSNEHDTEMSDAAPPNKENTDRDAGHGTEGLSRLRPRNAAGLTTPPPAPTRGNFISTNTSDGTPFESRPVANNANQIIAPAIAPAEANNPAAVNKSHASKAVRPPVRVREGRSKNSPWHTWDRLLAIMNQHLGDPSVGLARIHKLADKSLSYRQQSVGKKAIQQEVAIKGRQLSSSERNELRKAAVAADPSYNQLLKVMGNKGGKHTDEQIVRLAKGKTLIHRCCRCHKASKGRHTGKARADANLGGSRCACGHMHCLICLNVQRTGDSLIEFQFMGLEDNDDDDDEGNGDHHDHGMAGVTTAVGALSLHQH
ncbi:hypothetical protein SLS58_009214 [Diplodia intermedia]|uniref:Uncharacterized protein n=1 Tax=Diplodia intermedia TaxID=856260 RepID=A0ABR3TDR8_9PEZI